MNGERRGVSRTMMFSKVRGECLRPNGAADNSQGRVPLEEAEQWIGPAPTGRRLRR